MDRLRLSWTELRAQPFKEMLVIEAFLKGEAEAREVQRAQQAK